MENVYQRRPGCDRDDHGCREGVFRSSRDDNVGRRRRGQRDDTHDECSRSGISDCLKNVPSWVALIKLLPRALDDSVKCSSDALTMVASETMAFGIPPTSVKNNVACHCQAFACRQRSLSHLMASPDPRKQSKSLASCGPPLGGAVPSKATQPHCLQRLLK